MTRHAGGRSEVVGDDVFAVLEEHLTSDPPDVHWVGYFGYACRPDLPALVRPDAPMPDAVWMRTRTRAGRSTTPRTSSRPSAVAGGRPPDVAVPEEYAAAFAEVQEQLRAGNSYEVNLTYRLDVESDLDPVTAYLRLRALNPAPYAGFLRHHGRCLLSSSPERYAHGGPRRRDAGDQADQGHDAARGDARGGRGAAAAARDGPASSAPRT